MQVELARKAFSGKVALAQWKQGSDLWQQVEMPAFRLEDRRAIELGATALLPHGPASAIPMRPRPA